MYSVGMGIRALPAVASQPIATFDDEEIIPKTEMLSNDDAISDTSDDIYATDVEATQPPNLTQIESGNLILFSYNKKEWEIYT